jgi:hypothetical protein
LLGENMTLEEYAEQVIEYNNDSLRAFDLLDVDTDSIILAGHPGYRIIYASLSQNGSIIKQMEIGTLIDNRVYYLIYYAELEKYDDFLPVIQEMINSFKIGR